MPASRVQGTLLQRNVQKLFRKIRLPHIFTKRRANYAFFGDQPCHQLVGSHIEIRVTHLHFFRSRSAQSKMRHFLSLPLLNHNILALRSVQINGKMWISDINWNFVPQCRSTSHQPPAGGTPALPATSNQQPTHHSPVCCTSAAWLRRASTIGVSPAKRSSCVWRW